MKTVITVKVDEKVKRQAKDIAMSAGISLSAMINAFLTQTIATRRIELYAPEPMTPKLEKLIAGIEAEIAKGHVTKGVESVDEFLDELKR